MNDEFKILLDLVDEVVLDPHLYFILQDLKNGKFIELEWNKSISRKWRFRIKGDLLWTISSKETLIEDITVNNHSVDLDYLYTLIKNDTLTQVTFADRIVKKASEKLGYQEINTAIENMDTFFRQIEEMLVSLDINPKEKNNNQKKKGSYLKLVVHNSNL